ncbi:MAG: hypothetical protein HQL54_04510 [Magnetococcales bacterium]|nr:hypothetical protein [Magnetococcales bacterium]
MSGITISPYASDTDFPGLVGGALQFISQAGFNHMLPESFDDFLAGMWTMANQPHLHILLAHKADQVIGGIGVSIKPIIWSPKQNLMEEQFIWVDPNAPKTTFFRLMRATKTLAQQNQVHYQMFGLLSTSPAKLTNLYQSMGLQPVQQQYLGEL